MAQRQRQPKGVPVGGEFAATVHDETTMTLGVTTPTLHDMFSSGERGALTRAGVDEEWSEAAAAALGLNGFVAHQSLIEAKQVGLTPDQAATLFSVADGHSTTYLAPETANLDFDRVSQIPESMRPLPVRDISKVAQSDVDLDRLAEVHAHVLVDGKSPDRVAYAIEATREDIDADAAAATGSGDDWYRAKLCRAAGLDDAEAARWSPSYPAAIAEFTSAGWNPEDRPFKTHDFYDAHNWAAAGIGVDSYRQWRGNGFRRMSDARRYIEAGLGVDEATKWRSLAESDKNSQHLLEGTVGKYVEAGVPVEAVAEARRNGLRLTYESPQFIANNSQEEIASWTQASGGTSTAEDITTWRDKIGVRNPVEAARWQSELGRLSGQARRDMQVPAVRYITRHMEPGDVGLETGHPLVYAVAQGLGVDHTTLQEQVARSSGGTVEGCRTAFRRRKIEPPF